MNCPYCNAESKPDWGAQRSIHWFTCGTMTGNESSGRADQSPLCAAVERGALFDRITTLQTQLDQLKSNCDDWKRCATMFKALSEPENCPEGFEAFQDLRKDAELLFEGLSEKGNV